MAKTGVKVTTGPAHSKGSAPGPKPSPSRSTRAVGEGKPPGHQVTAHGADVQAGSVLEMDSATLEELTLVAADINRLFDDIHSDMQDIIRDLRAMRGTPAP